MATGSYIAQAMGGSTALVNVFQAAAPLPISPADMAEAEDLLGRLPIGNIPEPRGLPSNSIMPWPRNRFFVGRSSDLQVLARTFKDGGTAAVGQSPAVTGLGGQGKTQLAIEFAYRYGSWFKGGVCWISCATSTAMAETIAACGAIMYSAEPGFSDRPLAERIAMVAAAWSSGIPRLLIFDNCEGEAILDDWAPKAGGSRLLITTRRLSWSLARGIKSLPIRTLMPSEAVTLLHRHRPDIPQDDVDFADIARELGYLPLALELAGSYLARYQHETPGIPANYLKELRYHSELRESHVLTHPSLRIEDIEAPEGYRSLTGHEQNVARTFEVSLLKLRPEDAVDGLALKIFFCAAWLVPGSPIERSVLKKCLGFMTAEDLLDEEQETRREQQSRIFGDAVNRLMDLGLIDIIVEDRKVAVTGDQDRDQKRAEIWEFFEGLRRVIGNVDHGAIALHRLLAVLGQSYLGQADTAWEAVENAAYRELFALNRLGVPDVAWVQHLPEIAQAADRHGRDSAEDLLWRTSKYLLEIGNADASHALLEALIVRVEALRGSRHSDLADIFYLYSITQEERGEVNSAKASLVRALRRANKLDTAVYIYIRFSSILHKLGDFKAARRRLIAALNAQESIYGRDHPIIAVTLRNLSIMYEHCGEGDLARSAADRATTIEAHTQGQ